MSRESTPPLTLIVLTFFLTVPKFPPLILKFVAPLKLVVTAMRDVPGCEDKPRLQLHTNLKNPLITAATVPGTIRTEAVSTALQELLNLEAPEKNLTHYGGRCRHQDEGLA